MSDIVIVEGNNELNVAMVRIIPEPSDLLVQYQDRLAAAIDICNSDNPDRYVNIPGYGLQYACPAIPQLEDLMVQESIAIGQIMDPSEAYFVGAVMYHISGDTLVPYWWECPYGDGLQFRSPEALQAHIEEAHADILATKGTISNMVADGTVYITGIIVTWRNDSPFAIQGHIKLEYKNVDWQTYNEELTVTQNQDYTLSPGQSIDVYAPHPEEPDYGFYRATLTLVGAPLPGMLLDQKEAYFDLGGE